MALGIPRTGDPGTANCARPGERKTAPADDDRRPPRP